jgi:hypothetical protein
MRSLLGLVGSALTGLAAVISSLDNDADLVPFFVGLMFLGGLEAWAAHPPFEGQRRLVARGASFVWLMAAAWVGVLLLMSVTVIQASSPFPRPEATYLGLTATVYHAVGLWGGATFMLVSAFGPDAWFVSRSQSESRHAGGDSSW